MSPSVLVHVRTRPPRPRLIASCTVFGVASGLVAVSTRFIHVDVSYQLILAVDSNKRLYSAATSSIDLVGVDDFLTQRVGLQLVPSMEVG